MIRSAEERARDKRDGLGHFQYDIPSASLVRLYDGAYFIDDPWLSSDVDSYKIYGKRKMEAFVLEIAKNMVMMV